MRDFGRNVGAGAAKFGAQTLLRSRPKNIAVFVAQADRRIGLVLAFFNVMDVVFGETRRAVAAAGARRGRTARSVLAKRLARVDALT